MAEDETRLRQLLGGEDAAWLRARLRSRYEQTGALPARLTLRNPSDAQRELVDRLFGRAPSREDATLSLSVERLRDTLRDAAICDDLVLALVLLDGPLRDRRAEADAHTKRWEAMRAAITARIGERAWLHGWLDELLGTGSLKRAASGDAESARELVEQALRVIEGFPFAGVALPELAARTFGDAHALDKDRGLGQLVVRAAARRAALEDWQTADGRRECWAAVGVVNDELSAPVLTLNLDSHGEGLTDHVLALHAARGEAAALSLRQLARHRPHLGHLAGRPVFVCENPTIVAVAVERLGAACAPLVCTSGHLRASARVLLRELGQVGARLRVQADLDIDGLHIAAKTLAVPGASPWRMSAADYLAGTPGPPLRRDAVPDTAWDPALQSAMAERGTGVHEETLLDVLLADLARG